jgi:hypothetical protein
MSTEQTNDAEKQFAVLMSLFDEVVFEFIDKAKKMHPEMEKELTSVTEFVQVMHRITEIFYMTLMNTIAITFSSERVRKQIADKDPKLWIEFEPFGFNFAAFWLMSSDNLRECVWRYLDLIVKVCDRASNLPPFGPQHQNSVELSKTICGSMDSLNLVSVFHLMKNMLSENKGKFDMMSMFSVVKSLEGLKK